jgi:hypothetical protein
MIRKSLNFKQILEAGLDAQEDLVDVKGIFNHRLCFKNRCLGFIEAKHFVHHFDLFFHILEVDERLTLEH